MEERELKYLLPSKKFYDVIDQIKTLFPNITEKNKLQINYYYDTDKLELLREGITCRIRQSEEKLLGQYKKHSSNDIHRSQESEFEVSQLSLQIERDGQILLFQGQLVTHRESYKISPSIKIECDINMYLGHCDYEMEIEYSEGMYDLAKQIAEKLSLTKINLISKYERFMKAKQTKLFSIQASSSR